MIYYVPWNRSFSLRVRTILCYAVCSALYKDKIENVLWEGETCALISLQMQKHERECAKMYIEHEWNVTRELKFYL